MTVTNKNVKFQSDTLFQTSFVRIAVPMTFELNLLQLIGLFTGFAAATVTTGSWIVFALLAYGEIRAYRNRHPTEGGECMDAFWARTREILLWPSLLALPIYMGLRLGAVSISPEWRFLVFIGAALVAAAVYITLSMTIPNFRVYRRLVKMRLASERKLQKLDPVTPATPPETSAQPVVAKPRATLRQPLTPPRRLPALQPVRQARGPRRK